MLEIMDTAGTEQFSESATRAIGANHTHQSKNNQLTPPLPASIREMYMRYAQGFLLVFSITSTTSLAELGELREQIAHMKNHDPAIPIVLVGNKADLEDDRRVSRAKAFQVSQMWGNIPYYETSARRRLNVNEVFVDVCRQIIRKDLNGRKAEGGREKGGRDGRRKRRREGDRDKGSRCVIL